MRPFLSNRKQASSPRGVGAFLAAASLASLLAVAPISFSLFCAQRAFAADQVVTANAIPNEIVLWVPSGTTPRRVSEIANQAGCDVVANLAAPSPYYLLRIKGTTRPDLTITKKVTSTAVKGAVPVTELVPVNVALPNAAVITAIAKITAIDPNILADPNFVGSFGRVIQTGTQVNAFSGPTVTPNDPLYAQQWDMRMINMPTAWQVQSPAKSPIVVVLDSGFDVNHPDFFRNGTPIFLPPIDATTIVNGQFGTDVTDVVPHGTHVAGTVAAVTNNATGIAGVAGFNGNNVNVRLLPIRVGTFLPSEDAIVSGITIATQQGAAAVNMSFGLQGDPAGFNVLRQAVNAAITGGVVLVAAEGNDGFNNDLFPSYPASYPGVVAVSAVNNLSQLASYSTYGPNVTIAAPGGDFNDLTNSAATRIVSTLPLSFGSADGLPVGYGYEQGTSMAAPHVTGAAALLAAAGANSTEIVRTLVLTATPLPAPQQNDFSTGLPLTSQLAYGAGLLNVAQALIPRITLLGGEAIPSTTGVSTASDRGTTYFKTQSYDVSVVGLGNLIREIGADPANTSLTFRVEEATTPTTVLKSVSIPVSSLPQQAVGESTFNQKTFTLPVPGGRLEPGKYKGIATLTYRGISVTQTQYFEVLSYTQPIGLTLFSVPFKPTAPAGQAESQVLRISNNFELNRFDPLNPLGSGSGYSRYRPGSGAGAAADAYARFDNLYHTEDTDRKNAGRPAITVPLSYAIDNPTASLAPIGVGYWLNMGESTVLETEGTPATTPVAIPLYGLEDDQGERRAKTSGWNMIGAPFQYAVNWSTVTVRQQTPVGVRDYSLQEAIDAQIVNAQLVGWDVATRSYFYNVAPGGQLLPFHAYWVRALRDCTLIVPPSRASESLTSRAVKAAASSPLSQGEGWRVRLSASVAGDRDTENYIGQVKGASDGEDRFDIAKPPTGPSSAYVSLLGNDSRGKKIAYAYDMRPATPGRQKAEWTLAVGAGKGETDVTLAWDGLRNLPSRSRLVLHDTVTGKTISMNSRSSYTYKNAEAGATRLFTVSLATQNSAGPLQIRNVRTVSSGGGRGVQRSMNVRFALSQDADVQATVQTLSGKTVSVLTGTGRATSQKDVLLRWDYRSREGSELPTGPYVLEITARTDDGEVVTVKRPITYLQ